MDGKISQCMGVIFLLINRLKSLNLDEFNQTDGPKLNTSAINKKPSRTVLKRMASFSVSVPKEELPSISPLSKIGSKAHLSPDRNVNRSFKTNRTVSLSSKIRPINEIEKPVVRTPESNEKYALILQRSIRKYIAQQYYSSKLKNFRSLIEIFEGNNELMNALIKIQALTRSKIVWDSLRPKRKRTEIAREILSTEASYVRSLNVLVNVYMTTLESFGEEIVPASKIRSIFSEIKVILSYNEFILKGLQERMENWYSEGQRLGDIFLRLTDFLKVYTAYVNNYNNSVNTLQEISQIPEVAQALQECRNRKETGGMEIQSYLIMPIQRIPRYVLLLTDLFNSTPEGHKDYDDLSQALKKMMDVAKYVNQKKKEAENLLSVSTIVKHLVGMENPLQFNQPYRRYVRQGPFYETSGELTSQKSFKSRYLFLFNDSIICTKEQQKNSLLKGRRRTITSYDMDEIKNSVLEFKFLYVEYLLGATLQEIVIEDNPKVSSSFEINFSSGKRVILGTNDPQIREEWIQDIDEGIMSCLEKRRSRLEILPEEIKHFEVPPEEHKKSHFRGYLHVRNQKGEWKKRFFVLINDVLYRYKEKEHVGDPEKLNGTIHLLFSSVQFLGVMDRSFCFQLLTKSRIFYFSASSFKERLDWINIIRQKKIKHLDLIETRLKALENVEGFPSIVDATSDVTTKSMKLKKEESSKKKSKDESNNKDEPKRKMSITKRIKRKMSLSKKNKSTVNNIIKKGELYKISSSQNSKLTKYELSLRDEEMLYFKSGKSKPSGNINLLLVESVKEPKKITIKGTEYYKFTVVTSDEVYIFASQEQEEVSDWSKEIEKAVALLKSSAPNVALLSCK